MEYLNKLVSRGLIGQQAVDTAQSERDSSTHSIFGQRRAA